MLLAREGAAEAEAAGGAAPGALRAERFESARPRKVRLRRRGSGAEVVAAAAAAAGFAADEVGIGGAGFEEVEFAGLGPLVWCARREVIASERDSRSAEAAVVVDLVGEGDGLADELGERSFRGWACDEARSRACSDAGSVCLAVFKLLDKGGRSVGSESSFTSMLSASASPSATASAVPESLKPAPKSCSGSFPGDRGRKGCERAERSDDGFRFVVLFRPVSGSVVDVFHRYRWFGNMRYFSNGFLSAARMESHNHSAFKAGTPHSTACLTFSRLLELALQSSREVFGVRYSSYFAPSRISDCTFMARDNEPRSFTTFPRCKRSMPSNAVEDIVSPSKPRLGK